MANGAKIPSRPRRRVRPSRLTCHTHEQPGTPTPLGTSIRTWPAVFACGTGPFGPVRAVHISGLATPPTADGDVPGARPPWRGLPVDLEAPTHPGGCRIGVLVRCVLGGHVGLAQRVRGLVLQAAEGAVQPGIGGGGLHVDRIRRYHHRDRRCGPPGIGFPPGSPGFFGCRAGARRSRPPELLRPRRPRCGSGWSADRSRCPRWPARRTPAIGTSRAGRRVPGAYIR